MNTKTVRSNPDFIVIGAMKSGSTSLANTLVKWNGVFLTENKEPGFFSRDERYKKGIDFYEDLFKEADAGQLTSEASTCYSRGYEFPLAPKRIYDHQPDCKLVYILRNPVSRCYSDYAHRMNDRLTLPDSDEPIVSFSQALETMPEILDASDYFAQIQRYLTYFPAHQLHCLVFEELVQNPVAELTKLADFLGVSVAEEDMVLNHHNVSGDIMARRRSGGMLAVAGNLVPRVIKESISKDTRKKMRKRLDDILAKLLLKSSKDQLAQKISPKSDELNNIVYNKLKPSILLLEQYLGRDIDAWRSLNSQFEKPSSSKQNS